MSYIASVDERRDRDRRPGHPTLVPDSRRRSARRFAFRLVELRVLCTLVMGLISACYNPSIKNGGLGCALGTDQCPENYKCQSDGLCWRVGTLPPADASRDAVCSAPKLCGDQIGSPCDPVCQTGSCDWCSQKCSFSGDGDPVCSSRDNGGTRATNDSCTPKNAGQPQASDDCLPGNICLSGQAGDPAHCFALCRTMVDCPGSVACAPRPLPASSTGVRMVNVCDVVPTACGVSSAPCCDPINLTRCAMGSFCYLASPDGQTMNSRTSCEFSTGSQARTEACATSRDCAQKLGCAGDGFCHIVCLVGQMMCATGMCVPNGNQFGYCPL